MAIAGALNEKLRVTAYVGLGSNLGNRIGHLQAAVLALQKHPEITALRGSPVFETKAHTAAPGERQPDYLNAVVEVQTTLSAEALLDVCLEIERAAGRQRSPGLRWEPRPLDLDVLLAGETPYASSRLQIPHPRMHERRFVLDPLLALAPDLFVPFPYNMTVAQLHAACPDRGIPTMTGHSLPERR